MEEQFKIYVDRLKTGTEESLEGSCSPDFLELGKGDLEFDGPISYSGKAYVTDAELVMHFSVTARCSLPCSICNERTPVDLKLNKIYQVEALTSIKGAVYDFGQALREAILLEVPHYTECNGGQCPSRNELEQYFAPTGTDAHREGVLPFADLQFDVENND